jgi:hypothetical protein
MDESFLGGSTGAVGALASETKESILDEELEKLNDMKFQLKEENTAYLAKHADFNDLLDEFVGEIFRNKPSVIRNNVKLLILLGLFASTLACIGT